jgi:hypothetical protein
VVALSFVTPGTGGEVRAVSASPAEGCGAKRLYGARLELRVVGARMACTRVRKVVRGPCRRHAGWSCASLRAPGPLLRWSQVHGGRAKIEALRPPCARAVVSAPAWAAARRNDGGVPTWSQALADDALRCGLLDGMRAREVRALLGEPDAVEAAGHVLRYTVGPARGDGGAAATEALELRLGPGGAVDRAALVRGTPVGVRECGPGPLPLGGPPAMFDAMWERGGGGWTGGDGALSAPLPDGRVAWVFADTFIGGVTAAGRDERTDLVANTVVVQDGACLTTLAGGTRARPRALMEPAVRRGGAAWLWPASARVRQDRLELLCHRMERTGRGQFDWRFTGTELASFSLPGLRPAGVREVVADERVAWGGATVDDGPYTYVFGIEASGLLSRMHVARVGLGRVGDDPWRYWNGSGWVEDQGASAPVLDDVTTLSFIVDRGGWTLVTQRPVFQDEITLHHAPSPAGPWSPARTIARAAAPAGGYTYGATLHPELGGDRSAMLLSYSVNGWRWEDVLARPALYRPRFLRVDVR